MAEDSGAIPDVRLTDRTNSAGTLHLVADPRRYAVVRDRGHHRGFAIYLFDERSPEPRQIRTAAGSRWAEARALATQLLLGGVAVPEPSPSLLPLEAAILRPVPTSQAQPADDKPAQTLVAPDWAPPTSTVRLEPKLSAGPMNHQLQSVSIRHFKRITAADFDLHHINVLVGGNNSGKSSIIQAFHFSVALLQTIQLSGQWKASTSLNPNQLIYSPSDDIYALGANGKLPVAGDQIISVGFVLTSGDACGISVSRGKNRNVVVAIKNPDTARELSRLESPFSIFSPGLAGIAKRENYVSDGVLLRTLARGDAKLILRNTLHRLSHNPPAWSSFLGDLAEIFPRIDISVSFAESTAEFIDVSVHIRDNWIPLELAGTGVLQAMQILSYIHLFSPSIVVLDEPDSHLHPNNQRLLCGLLRRVAEERDTQVVLTTHSRHVVDALGSAASFLWVRNGTVDVAGADDEIGILLDIGALDVKERAGQPSTTTVVLTEDDLTRSLELIVESSGFDLARTAVLSYYGVTGISQLKPLVKIIQSTNTKAKLVLHRDRDCLTEDEVELWKKHVRALGVEPFLTQGRDIEACS